MGNFCTLSVAEKPYYKWVIAFATCLTYSFSCGFAAGFMNTMGHYLNEHYNERALSSSIGGIQVALSFLATFPAALILKKIGERRTQLIGGLLTVVSMAALAFTTSAWQGLICGIFYGTGAGLTTAASYSIIGIYFTEEQVVPCSAMTMSFVLMNMTFPLAIGSLMNTLKFRYGLLVCSALNILNIFSAILFQEKTISQNQTQINNELDEESSHQPKIVLKFKERKPGVFNVPRTWEHNPHTTQNYHKLMQSDSTFPDVCESASACEEKTCATHTDPTERSSTSTERKVEKTVQSTGRLIKQSGRLSLLLAPIQQDNYTQKISSPDVDDCESVGDAGTPLPVPTLYEKFSSMPGYKGIADLLDDTSRTKESLISVFKNPAAIHFIICSTLGTGGFVSYHSNVGDYCIHEIGFTPDQYNLGITIAGITQLIQSGIFIVMARYFSFSSSLVYVTSAFGCGCVTLSLLMAPTLDMFYAAMAIKGVLKSLYLVSLFSDCLEVSSPTQSVITFMLQTCTDGIGGLIFTYLVAYLQVKVNGSAGLALAGGLQILAALFFLPRSIYYLTTPKKYETHDSIKENIKPISYNVSSNICKHASTTTNQ